MRIRTVEPSLEKLIGAQQPRHSLSQEFYIDENIFQKDMEGVISKQWLLVEHESRIKQPGDYFLFEIGDESIIIIRGEDNEVYAHYNVCRHRGSRICLEKEGHKKLLVCPYHSWSYRQDGSLQKAAYMPDGFEPDKVSLVSCHVKVFKGIIFVCLSDTPPDFEKNTEGLGAFFDLQSTSSCKVAHRHTFEMAGNWKQVIENFSECYHCFTNHPELCAVRTEASLVAAGAGPSAGDRDYAAFAEEMRVFEDKAKKLGQLPDVVDEAGSEQWFRFGVRSPLKEGCLSETDDGQPMAPLLKGFKDWDGGYTGVALNPLSLMLATNDVALLFRFTPRSVDSTHLQILWLVNADAQEGKDYDLNRVKWTWERAGIQDLTVIQNNFLGVKSKAYKPGVHGIMEATVSDFCRWYLANLKRSLAA